MRDNTKRTIGGDLFPPEEQPKPKKPNVVNPFSHSGSSFKPWKPFCQKSLDVEQKNLHLGNSSISVAQGDNNVNIAKSTSDHAEKNLINGGYETSKADGDEKAARTDEVQADKPTGSGCNTQLDMDRKRIKRMLSNRASARRSRIKKIIYEADLKEKEKSYQSMIALIQSQIATYENHKQELLFEHHKLKQQIAVRERERLLQEVEIEKSKAEVTRLSELYKKLMIEKQARMMNTGVAIQFMPNSNFNPSGFRQFICLNSNQDKMQDITKSMISGNLLPLEEQSRPKKPKVVKHFSHAGSSFQPWKPYVVAQGDNNINIEKSTLDHVEKDHTNGDGTISKNYGDEKAAKSDEVQADKPAGLGSGSTSGSNTQLDKDPKKLRRIIQNRETARRSRMKKIEYAAHLEEKEKFYQSTIAILEPQIATYENQKRELLIEHHGLKLQMAVREKERILQEVEIEKNRAEVNRLSELYKKLIIEARSS